MRHRLFVLISLLPASLFSIAPCYADSINFMPNLFASYRDFTYSTGNTDVGANLYSVGVGLTATYRRFYMDISYETNPSSGKEHQENNTVYFERRDVATSVGYAVNDSISIFGGYKYGQTRLVSPPSAIAAGTEVSLEGRGFYIGAGAGWQIEHWGFLSFSAAYANLKANYEDLTFLSEEGNASGTSLSIKWKGSLSENLSYDVSLIRHDYYYEDFETIDNISEQILSWRAGLAYRF